MKFLIDCISQNILSVQLHFRRKVSVGFVLWSWIKNTFENTILTGVNYKCYIHIVNLNIMNIMTAEWGRFNLDEQQYSTNLPRSLFCCTE